MADTKIINLTLLRLLVLLFLIQSMAMQIAKGQACYELIWSDEFNYSGLPDLTKWSYETGGGGFGNNELEYYTEKRLKNARVDDSVLIIEAHKENYEDNQYTSARLITYDNHLSWKYGKIEARMKLPYGQGIWPAFWMLNNTIKEGVRWPGCGEIDIMELIGGGEDRDNRVYGTLHYANAGGSYEYFGGSYKLSQGIFNDGFHVFTITWNETKIEWFVDGLKYHEANISAGYLSEFHGNYFILLNLAVGGNWPGNPNSSTVFPQQLVVDYVRVYQLNEIPEILGKTKVLKAEKSVLYKLIESADFSYNWIVPEDAEIIDGQGTSKINVNWGCQPGAVKCELTTLCNTYTIELPVDIDALQVFGHKLINENETDLEYYVLPTINTSYVWTLPDMVSSTSNVNTNLIHVNWGTKDGTIKVNIKNTCGMDSALLNVKIMRQLPYPNPDQPQIIPGTIQSVNFDFGGEGIAYHDNEPINQGLGSRQDEGVDTEPNDGSENVGWIVANEWLEYTIKVESTKTYDFEIRIASTNSAGKFKISFNGIDKTGVINVPSTGSWNSFSSIFINDIELSESDTLMRVDVVNGDFNLGRLIFADSITNAVINYADEIAVKIYPTLPNDKITIENLKSEASYSISDISGRVVKTGIIMDNLIYVSEIKKGSYILQIKSGNLLISKKFIKM